LAHDPKNQQASGSIADLAMIYAASGRKEDAERIYRNLQSLPNPGSISNYNHVMAALAGKLGHIDEGFSYLKMAQSQKLARTIWMRVDRDLEALRPDPRFKAILKASKLLP
jgi:Flp pilus assembly protein TadD